MNIKGFAKELRQRDIKYDEATNYHWDGFKTVSNEDMDIMCINHFGRDYDLLTEPEKRNIREEIFRQLRSAR